MEDVKIRSANRRCRETDYGIGLGLDGGSRHFAHFHVERLAIPKDSFLVAQSV
jgi:hypothetical protein